MSGGSFDYNNYQLDALADDIERVVKRNHTKDDWGFCNNFTPETIEKLENTSNQLRILSKKYIELIGLWLVMIVRKLFMNVGRKRGLHDKQQPNCGVAYRLTKKFP